MSRTACVMHVDKESHWVEMSERRCRVSLNLRSRGILRSRAVTIFATLSGLLDETLKR